MPKKRRRKSKSSVTKEPKPLPHRACIDPSISYADHGMPRGRAGGRTKKMRKFANLKSQRQKNREKNAQRNRNLAAATRKRKATARSIVKTTLENCLRRSP